MKIVLRIILWVVLALIIAIILLPFVFKDRVKEEIKIAINENVNAEVDFKDASLSLIKAFPNLSIEVSDVNILGKGVFKGIPLMSMENALLSVNLSSLIGDNPLEINKISLNKPYINIIIDEQNRPNYDIFEASSNESDSETDITGSLKSYAIKNGRIRYRDINGGIDTDFKNISHSGKADFSSTVFDLNTNTSIDEANLTFNGIPYLSQSKIEGEVDINVDLNQNKYTLKKNNLKLNQLSVISNGFVQLIQNGYDVDLTFDAPSTEFKDLFSLVPNAYTDDYKNIDAKGSALFKGTIKGKYTENGTYPAVDLAMQAKDGYVKYPGFSESIQDINLDVKVLSTKNDMSDLSVNIPTFKMKIADEEFSGKLLLTEALANFNVDAFLKGKVDLSVIQKVFPNEGIKTLNGIADLDLTVKADKASIESGNYSAIKFEGVSKLNGIKIEYEDYPAFVVPQGSFTASPQSSSLNVSNASFGNSEFDWSTNIENPLSLTTDQTTKIKTDINSKRFDYNEIMKITDSSVEPSSSDANQATEIDSFSESIITNTEIDYTVHIDKVNYEAYSIDNINSKGLISSESITMQNASLNFEGSKVNLDGNFNNAYNYVMHGQKLDGNIDIAAKSIDLNKMYEENSGTAEEEMETVLLPKDMDIDVNANIGSINYGDYLFEDIKGLIEMDNGKADFKNVNMKALGGEMQLNGFYDSSMESRPEFSMAYNLNEVPFKKLYETSLSFQILAPIARFIEGNLNSTLTMKGPLGKDMMPVLNEISAAGFLETLDGKLSGFEPISKLADKLGIEKLKNLSLENTKNWFEIEDGAVSLKPSIKEFDDMKFTIGGKHFIDQSIDYNIKAEIPREKMKKNIVSGVAESGLSFLEKEAGKRGVNIGLGDMVYLDIQLTGNITNPKIKIVPTGSGGKSASNIIKDEITNQLDVIKDTLTKEVTKKANILKDTITKKATKVVDEQKVKIKTKVKTKVDQAKEEAKKEVNDKIKDVVGSSGAGKAVDTITSKIEDKVGDVLGDKAKEEAEKAKEKLKDLNPFKKKKKD